MDERIIQAAQKWLGDGYDEQTKAEVRNLLDGDPKLLEDAFYKTLEFGTGGLRGIMGAGSNRMNRYTVGMATQGFANYLKKCFGQLRQIKVAITHDCRNNSDYFSKIVAEIFEANGFHVYLTKELRPTPELSYAIRYYGCQGGVMVTASHNPKIYNGYKAYWSDGAQVIAPHDKNIIAEVNKITDISQVKWHKAGGNASVNCADGKASVNCCPEGVGECCKGLSNAEIAERKGLGFIEMVGEELDDAYLKDLATLHVSPESVKRHHDLGIVYTPLHGCGVKIVPRALKEMGFTNVHLVEEQCVNTGEFPTVQSPNPEEPTALKMAVDLAERVGAEIVCASDPDADRCGIAVRDENNKLVLLNGNQMNCILTYYMLQRWQDLGRLKKDTDKKEIDSNSTSLDHRFPYIIKTIVTSNLMSDIADHFGVKWYNVLTGFKNIAEVILHNEGKGIYVCGGEESFGFAVGEFVRDKDSPITVSLICECAAWCKDRNTTVWGLLQSIYKQFGERKDWLRSYTFPGIEGKKKIDSLVETFRTNPPTHIAGSKIIEYRDYLKNDYFAPEVKLAKSNVLQYISEDGTVVSLRPSGTEPKIKFYFNLRCNPGEDVEAKAKAIDEQFAVK
ncbi:MAG: phospho-sugar mutase [Bacteroidales bacterium]|jgi:phosphoglucomutase|nr:phospho-sugar mutase [Bacteroidales bacterium]